MLSSPRATSGLAATPGPDTSTITPRFTFVLEGDKRLSRKLARQHVANEMWRKRKLRKSHHQDEETSHEDVFEVDRQEWKPETKTIVPRGPNMSCQPQSDARLSFFNPFPDFDLECGPDAQELLHTYCRVIPDIMDHRAGKTDFHRLPYLYTKVVPLDPSPQHLIISFTMENIARLRGEQIPPAARSHKAMAVRLISQRLANPKLAIEDQSIGAIVSIASHEMNMTEDPNLFHIHMNGLDRIIKLRGGLAGLKSNPPLQWVVQCLDLSRSFINGTSPKYALYAESTGISELTQPDHDFTQDRASIIAVKELDHFTKESMWVIQNLEEFTSTIKSAIRDGSFVRTPALVASQSCSYFLNCKDGNFQRESHRSRIRSCQLAALVFAYIALHELSTSPPMSWKYLERTKSALLKVKTEAVKAVEMLVVVLLQGEGLKTERRRRTWFVANAIMALQRVNLDTWGVIEKWLWNFLWADLAEPPDDETKTSKSIFVDIFKTWIEQDRITSSR